MARATAASVRIPPQIGFFIGRTLGKLRPAGRGLVGPTLIGRDDHSRAFPVCHQDRCIRPELLEFADAHLLTGCHRVEAVSKEQFSPIDVTDP